MTCGSCRKLLLLRP
ncbi:hypothetical protein DJ017_09835 [Phenylobacterium soli]|uniref:Uncharacterized protein n=1 Tax=Phenylobacterium soli TaxID=2170551 RepID=A0A328ARZ1_9CAUL|nr:hypothetical protein DJ017_09835 [Phenylobacterium soli]